MILCDQNWYKDNLISFQEATQSEDTMELFSGREKTDVSEIEL